MCNMKRRNIGGGGWGDKDGGGEGKDGELGKSLSLSSLYILNNHG